MFQDNDPMSKLLATAEDLKGALTRYAQAYNICASIDSERQRVQQLNNEINQLLSSQFPQTNPTVDSPFTPYQPQKQNSDQQTQHQPLLYPTFDSPLTTTQDNQQSQPDLLNTTFELQPRPLLDTNVQISPIIPSCQNEPQSIPFIDDSLTYSQCEDMSQQLKTIIEDHSLLTCSENSPTKGASIDAEPQQTPDFDSLGLNSQDYRDIDIGVETYIQEKLSKEKKSISPNDAFDGIDVVSIAQKAAAESQAQTNEEVLEETKMKPQRKIKGVTSPCFELLSSTQGSTQSQEIQLQQIPIPEEQPQLNRQHPDKRVSEPSFLLKSPFKQRIVDIVERPTSDENILFKWIEEGQPEEDM